MGAAATRAGLRCAGRRRSLAAMTDGAEPVPDDAARRRRSRRGVAAFVAATALFAAAVGVSRCMELSAPRDPDAREAPDLAR